MTSTFSLEFWEETDDCAAFIRIKAVGGVGGEADVTLHETEEDVLNEDGGVQCYCASEVIARYVDGFSRPPTLTITGDELIRSFMKKYPFVSKKP